MSPAQLSKAVHLIRAQAVFDHQWMGRVEQSVSNRAELIDEGRKVHRLEVVRMKAAPHNNDSDLETILSTNDEMVKRVIEGTARHRDAQKDPGHH